MTPQQAIQILDRLAASFQMNRSDHFRAQQAVEVLMQVIKNAEDQGKAKKAEFPKDIKKVD